MTLYILPAAVDDLTEGRDLFDHAVPGMGTEFLDSLGSEIESIPQVAKAHGQVVGSYRLIGTRFPFLIYYKIQDDVATVWRVLDARQDRRASRR